MKKILLTLISVLAAIPGVYAQSGKLTTTKTEDLKVWLEIPTIIADGKTVNYIKVFEHDNNHTYTAFNMEIVFPMQGMSVNKVKNGRVEVNDIFLTDRNSGVHTIDCNMLNGDDLRIISIAQSNAELFPDDADGKPLDHLFTVGLIADPSIATGDYTIKFEGIKFVMKDGNACVPVDDPVSYVMKVNNPDNPTGVEEVEAETLDPAACYDLQGRKVNPSAAKGKIVISKGHKYLVR